MLFTKYFIHLSHFFQGLDGGAFAIVNGVRETLHALLDMFSLPVEALPIVYLIFKESQADFKIASSRLLEGIWEIENCNNCNMNS